MSRIIGSCLRAAALAGLLGSGLVAVVAPAASAATITVTTTADVVNGGDGLTSLREAFTTAGSNGVDDTITLGAGLTYALTNCTGPLTHADGHGLIVQGNGSVIDQTCDAKGIIDSTDHAGRLELQDLIIDGGPNTTATGLEGAAVRSDSELLLANVEIRNVLSPGGSVVWSSFDHGITPYRLTLNNSNLHNNTGSIVSCDNCSLAMSGTTISDNVGSGLSLVDGYPVTVSNSTISGNTRAGISNTGQGFPTNKMEFEFTTIANNGRVGIRCVNCGRLSGYSLYVANNGLTAADALGGISFSMSQRNGTPASSIGLLLSGIEGNRSTVAGGGLSVTPVLVEDGGNAASTNLDRTPIDNNTAAGDGGGAAISVGNFSNYKGGFSGNTATGRGGGVAFLTPGPESALWFDTSEINNNTAGGDGGGVYAFSAGSVSGFQPTISGNTSAGNGGGVKVGFAYQAGLEGSKVFNNKAVNGAGLDLAAESVTFDKTTINSNTATSTGGGARISAFGASFLNSTINANTATVGGGLNFTTATQVTLTHVTMADDKATTGAHIAAVPAATVAISRSALVLPITGTSCAGVGGAFHGTSGGFSVLRDATCSTIASDLVTAADPQLAPLTNGFPSGRTPAATSPLGGRVPVASCTTEDDQRMQGRPLGANCDAGSVEFVETVAASPYKALTDLIAEVKALHLAKPVEIVLVLRLTVARAAVKNNQVPAAKVQLNGFITKVKAQSGAKIPAAAAAQLVSKATAIRNSL
ncbi:right-handed parallel beta-helix repeat-containing protein [Streptomyces sp. SID13031]|uniref:right-handed parallel beta-helix repeat-containing protein n=1 Tax=Streptomyces sp. SID13031 TaxID=2706046 RepID=UPI0013C9D98B|nr:right-handed parallel beta-helix repeat-containing protein [Streptomyces sp. SID13031]NEA33449.1 right-handed parallel beta-helix repeat-containing protein [Streptomyces sp. SID13031]